MSIKDLMQKAVNFHGHSCPGLALGVLVSKYILDHGNDFSIDEELVAVVETNSCGVDAIQALLGTTFGKGNLKFKDYGKNNYTFYNRHTKKAVKLKLKKSSISQNIQIREKRIEKILNSSPEEIYTINSIVFKPPEEAQIHDRIICDNCGDPTMSTRIKAIKGKNFCIPCYKE